MVKIVLVGLILKSELGYTSYLRGIIWKNIY